MKRLILLFFSTLCIGCQDHSNRLRVGATPVPHAELLKIAAPELEKEGIKLEIIEIDDYNTPNQLLSDRELDANFFQHLPFLEEQNNHLKNKLVPLVAVHIEPMAIYSSTLSSLEEIPEKGIVAIPCDPTNEARALELLQAASLISLRPAGLHATVLDIIDNPKQLKIEEVDAPFLPRILPDVSLAVIPANFALQAGLCPQKDGLYLEQGNSPYANIIAIREGEEGRPDLQRLKEVMTSPLLKDAILKKYNGNLLPIEDSVQVSGTSSAPSSSVPSSKAKDWSSSNDSSEGKITLTSTFGSGERETLLSSFKA